MRKNVSKLIVLVLFFCGVYCFYNSGNENSSFCINDFTFRNIEALAHDENGGYVCFDMGDIDCYGEKVKLKIEGLSLDN